MSAFLEALAGHAFLQHALAAGVLASIACGIVGSYVVVKRIGYLAGGIAHTVLGGMGIAYFLGRSPIGGALVAALLAAAIIGWVSLRLRQHEDTIIGALWAIGMATGILFISRTPGYNADLVSYLFGSILMVPREDLFLIAALDGAIVVLVLLFRKAFLAVCFDEEFARLRGVPVDLFYLVLLWMVALTVVILVQVVGLIMVIALLTLPAAIAGQFARSLAAMMFVATLLGVMFTGAGLALSYEPDLPAGATIVLVAGTVYLLSAAGRGFYLRFGARRMQAAPGSKDV
ncbi:MAG TPA: metal ABC transporter permease [Burkholderiales bacterium]|nr:metal ABC transporter permease [Burkholderiales bacterium]